MEVLSNLKDAESFLFSRLGKHLRVATPLGLGKPNQLLNQIYNRAKKDSSIELTLFTALSLDTPDAKSDLERRFTEDFYKRHFGADYPRLDYLRDAMAGTVPPNITLHEFYFQAGTMLHHPRAQQNYISLNYTHAAQSIFDLGIEAIVQLIARSPDGKSYSLSCNPDLTLDLHDLYRKQNKKLLIIGVIHPELPFLGGDAEVTVDFFDAVLDSAEVKHKLFAPPRVPVGSVDYLIGLHASRLIRDDGTLQIGIGSLSDSLVYSTLLRHQNNERYKALVSNFANTFSASTGIDLYDDPFTRGLYGTSEMLMDGFMHLRKAGILKRIIFDRDERAKRYLHGAFFLGSKDFYQWLRDLHGEDYQGLSMTRVSKVNDLYDAHELALRRQRKNARFFNTCMEVSLLGGAASETLEDGEVVSGVGGQYNFVAMSHELPDSHSVLMLKSARTHNGRRKSNIVWSPGHLTIPRHLRGVVITEYGIAHLKGQSDEICIQRLLQITDAEFQDELAEQAKSYGKLAKDWQPPARARNNTAANVHNYITQGQKHSLFPRFPFGSDFTLEEEHLQAALLKLKSQTQAQLLQTLFKGMTVSPHAHRAELRRMKLESPKSFAERAYQRVLLGALK